MEYSLHFHRDDSSPDINSDPEDFHSPENYERTEESSRNVEEEQLDDFEVNPPRPSDFSPTEEDVEVNFENFRVEFGSGAPADSDATGSPSLVSDFQDTTQELELDVQVPLDLPQQPDSDENEGFVSSELDSSGQGTLEGDSQPLSSRDRPLESYGYEEPYEPSVSSTTKPDGQSYAPAGFFSEPSSQPETRPGQEFDFNLDLQSGKRTDSDMAIRGDVSFRSPDQGPSKRDVEPPKASSRSNLTSKSTGRKRGRPKMVRGPSAGPSDSTSSAPTGETQPTGERDQEVPERPPSSVKSRKYMDPAAVIYNYERGRLSNSEAVEILQEIRRSKMLHKSSDKVYIDKEGDVRIPKGYNFGKSRDSRGKTLRKHGLTRIEREIQAYQKSTHMLIPRSIFARIVREIAQGWFRGEGQIKFTVEALAALQVATEDEIIKLLETSTVLSRHAKRITLRVEDMRLARFCRGRQEYEFTHMNL